MDSSTPNLDDYSASATTVIFERPVPLLRGPVPAGESDDPNLGPYVLAFRSPMSWAIAYKRCQTIIREQCEEGARIGCAVTASKNCKSPWWHSLAGRSCDDMKEREKCEEREFEGCLAAAKEKCADFTKEKCSGPFLDARIAVARVKEGESEKEMAGLVRVASMPVESRLIGLDVLVSGVKRNERRGVTNYRARDMVKVGDTMLAP